MRLIIDGTPYKVETCKTGYRGRLNDFTVEQIERLSYHRERTIIHENGDSEEQVVSISIIEGYLYFFFLKPYIGEDEENWD